MAEMTKFSRMPQYNRDTTPFTYQDTSRQSGFNVASRWRELFWNRGLADANERSKDVTPQKKNKIDSGRLFVEWVRRAIWWRKRKSDRPMINSRENEKAKEAYDHYSAALSMAQYALNLSVRYELKREKYLAAAKKQMPIPRADVVSADTF